MNNSESEFRINMIVRRFEEKEILPLKKFLRFLSIDLNGITEEEIHEAYSRKHAKERRKEGELVGCITYPAYDHQWKPTTRKVTVYRDGQHGYKSIMNNTKTYWRKSDIEAGYISFQPIEEYEKERKKRKSYEDFDTNSNSMNSFPGDENMWSTPFEE